MYYDKGLDNVGLFPVDVMAREVGDAVAVDDSGWIYPGDEMHIRFQKMIYNARSRDVTAKYVAGQKLF